MFLAKLPHEISRYCVYDPNIAVSAIFQDATFYNAVYDSPTREGIRLDEARPFVEVDIEGEKNLVDPLTKRILKSSWFKNTYHFEVKFEQTISQMDKESLEQYKTFINEKSNLSRLLLGILPSIEGIDSPDFAEMKYEIERSKEYFPEEWKKYEFEEIQMEKFMRTHKIIY